MAENEASGQNQQKKLDWRGLYAGQTEPERLKVIGEVPACRHVGMYTGTEFEREHFDQM